MKAMGGFLTVGWIAHTASMKVITSQLPLFRLPVSEEMTPNVASTMEPSAFAMKHPERRVTSTYQALHLA